MIDLHDLPKRRGTRPRTTYTNPHTQLDQNAPAELVAQLADRAFELPGVQERPSLVSVPGARALWLQENQITGPPEAFMIGREFAHIHPLPDGSMHIALPRDVTDEAVAKGWAEPHPIAQMGYLPSTVVMVYGPRDSEELEIVFALVRAAHRAAAPDSDTEAPNGRR